MTPVIRKKEPPWGIPIILGKKQQQRNGCSIVRKRAALHKRPVALTTAAWRAVTFTAGGV